MLAYSPYVAGSGPDVASKHLVFDISRSIYCSTGFWLGLRGALLFCCMPFLLHMSANSPAMNSCALSCLTANGWPYLCIKASKAVTASSPRLENGKTKTKPVFRSRKRAKTLFWLGSACSLIIPQSPVD